MQIQRLFDSKMIWPDLSLQASMIWQTNPKNQSHNILQKWTQPNIFHNWWHTEGVSSTNFDNDLEVFQGSFFFHDL